MEIPRFRRVMKLFAALLVVFSLLNVIVAERNAQEEAICAPFLTSRATSPLSPLSVAPRNLKVDEDAEFSCELVLQDVDLPLQIRLTIHEGLYYLALRHIQMGLHRERTAVRHAKILAAIMPKSFQFQYFLGSWSINHEVFDPETAVVALEQCLYGNASNDDSRTRGDIFSAHRLYIQALLVLRREEDAAREIKSFLDTFPLDFEAQFWRTTLQPGSQAPELLRTLERLIEENSDLPLRNYVESSYCETIRHAPLPLITTTSVPALSEFAEFTAGRRPVKVTLGSVKSLSEQLGWQVHKWVTETGVQSSYLLSSVEEDADVLVETTPVRSLCPETTEESSEACVVFGLATNAWRRRVALSSVLENNPGDKFQDHSWYLNVQEPGSGKPPFHSPLHKWSDDIPLRENTFFDVFRSNLSDVNLWLGHNPLSKRWTTSRLHRDALDNLYVVLHGRKTFRLWHPCHAGEIPTVAPSFFVNEDGLATQLDVNAFKDHLRSRVNITHGGMVEIDGKWHRLGHQLEEVLLGEVQYSTENLHFARESSHQPNNLPPPTIEVTLEAGDMLYLPTGWFHEVSSAPGTHMAINFWWKPPHWKAALEQEQAARTRVFEYFIRSLIADADVVKPLNHIDEL